MTGWRPPPSAAQRVATQKLIRAAVGNFPAARAADPRVVRLGQGQRQLVQPWIVADHQRVDIALGQGLQAFDQLVPIGQIEFVLDQAARPRREPGQRQIEGLAGARRARAQHHIDAADRRRQIPADQPRRLAATPVQRPIAIRDILFPARFGMAQQVQQMHLGFLPERLVAMTLPRRHDRFTAAR